MNSVDNYERGELDRRQFLRLAITAGSGLLLAACASEAPTPMPKSTPTPTESAPEKQEVATTYPEHQVTATVFYVGEKASRDNAGISNISTEWESDARKAFGGVDNPSWRTPAGLPNFTPKENPFYIALPASEYNDEGPIKGAREASPWASEAKSLPSDDSRSLFKGRWVKVSTPDAKKKVYGQWLDTGPSDDPDAIKDYGYVFGDGSQQPKNSYGLKAGIDLSPAMAAGLSFGIEEGSAEVVWRFVDPKDVPAGLWTTYPAITNKTHWD